MRIYIESTIPSYVVARPARDLLQAARQQITRDWWETERRQHDLFTSQLVLDEISAGEPEMADERVRLLGSVPILLVTHEVLSVSREIVAPGVLPARAERDATHIAFATAYGLDVLLTWNCRHIANAAVQPRLRAIAAFAGYVLPELRTVEELSEKSHE